jgi:hypothetical protein
VQDRNPEIGAEDNGDHRRDSANNRVTPARARTAETPNWLHSGRKRRVGKIVSPNALTKYHPEDREQADGDGYWGNRGPQDVAFPA